MPTVIGRVAALIAMAAALAVPAAQTPQEPPKGTGLILGRVVDATSGGPVAGATVSVIGGSPATAVSPTGEVFMAPGPPPAGAAASGAPRQVITDSDGRFMFRDLASGRHSIRTTAPGYLPGGSGQRRPNGPTQSIELKSDNEKLGGVTIRMWRGATIGGTVVDEMGEPVIGLSVRTIRRTVAGGRVRLAAGATGITDDRGTYRIPNLVPGDYIVGVMSSQATLPVSTSEEYMQLMMSGGSSINSDLYRNLTSSGAPFPSMGGFRVGDLILQTGNGGRGGGSSAPAPLDDAQVFTYPTVFYPAAALASQGTVLTLGSGDDRPGIDLRLRLTPSVRVSGTILGPDGPAANLGVKLFPQGAEDFTSDLNLEAAVTATNAAGAFTFLGVTPGQYTLKVLRIPRPIFTSNPSAMTMVEVSGPNGMIMGMSSSGPSSGPPPPLPTEPTLWATMPVAVGEAGVSNLSVQLRAGVRISGRLEFDGTKEKPAAAQLQRAGVSILSIEGRSFLQTTAVRVESDGRFNTGGYVPGRHTVSASLPVQPGGASRWTFKSATLAGRNVSDEPLDIGGEDITDLVITFTDRPTEVSGTVLDAKGQPDASAEVIIFPADSQGWKQGTASARRLRNIRPSTAGGYSVTGLPPGAYFIAAVSSESISEWQDPKFLDTLTRVAERISLGDGETKTQSLSTKAVR